MEKITSTKNEYIKTLCKLKNSSARNETGLFLAEGQKICEEAYRSGLSIERCLITEKYREHSFWSALEDSSVLISEHVAEKLSAMDTAPGCFMVIKKPSPRPPVGARFILALDHLSDPANLGAILRSAEAFGVKLVLMSEECVDLYSPKVLRAAMGSAFRICAVKDDLPKMLDQFRQKGYRILGTGLNSQHEILNKIQFDAPTVIVVGNEANGVSSEVMKKCDQNVYIPMLGDNESLNVAVAASIIMWEQSKWN